jgi:hypothetical protein
LRFLRRRAYAGGDFARVAAGSAFGGCDVRAEGIELEVKLTK